jgi:spermidine synthase
VSPSARRLLPLARLLFFLSGAAGLVYQVVWSRLLQEVFGVSAHAVTAVLATYLGGLALGSWLLGPIVDRHSRPLRTYGFLELGVAATALLGTVAVHGVEPLHQWIALRLAPDSAALVAVRMVLASLVVLPPTVLMGGTLPAMSRAFVARSAGVGREIAFLYALNTAGAVAGSLAAGFWLIRAAGVHATLWLAVLVNAGVGLVALAAARKEEASPAPDTEPGPPGAAAALASGNAGAWVLAAMALSGFSSLALEVLWTRVLTLALGTTTYAFVTMLAAFLVGIALGSLLMRPHADRLTHPRRVFGWIQVAIAASTLASLPLARSTLLAASQWVEALEHGWLGQTAGRFAVSCLLMLLPATLIGTTFPLASRIWARSISTLGGRVGSLQGANTLGNVCGALAAGFFVLSRFGMQRGIALVTLFNLVAAGVALLPVAAWRKPRDLARALPACATLGLAATLIALWRPGPLPGTGGGDLDTVTFYEEGLVSTVAVYRRASDGRQLVMAADGVNIGQSAAGVDRKQQVLAHLPFLLHPGTPRRVYSVGLGTAILVGEVALHPGVEQVDCAEISPSVISGARRFDAWNHGVLDDARLRVIPDDGVNHLRRSSVRYDLVISDGKSRSGHAGNGVFYSDDYYRIVLDHLSDDGIAIQWVPLDMMPEDYETVVRTFVGAFPHAYAWYGPQSSFLVGTNRPLVLEMDRLAAEMARAEYAGLRRYGWSGPAEVAALLVADGPAMRKWLGGRGSVNSLEHPVLEFYSPTAAALQESLREAENAGALRAMRGHGLVDVRWGGAPPRDLSADARAVDLLLAGLYQLRGDAAVAVSTLQAAADASPDGVVRSTAAAALNEAGRVLDLQGRVAEATLLYFAARAAWPDLPEARANLGRALAAQGRVDEAVGELEAALALNPELRLARLVLAHVLESRGRYDGAAEHLREALKLAPADAESHEGLGLVLASEGRLTDALAEFREALRLSPDWPLALERVAVLLAADPDAQRRDPREAVHLAKRATDLTDGRDPGALEVMALAYAAAGRFEDAASTEAEVVEMARARGNAELESEASGTAQTYRNHESPKPLMGR